MHEEILIAISKTTPIGYSDLKVGYDYFLSYDKLIFAVQYSTERGIDIATYIEDLKWADL